LAININLFERVFRIIDCDDFTRKFYEYMEVALNNPESLPKDNFADYTDHKDIKVNKYFYYKKKPNFISKMINKKNKFIIKKI
jgi:hypothetical protein